MPHVHAQRRIAQHILKLCCVCAVLYLTAYMLMRWQHALVHYRSSYVIEGPNPHQPGCWQHTHSVDVAHRLDKSRSMSDVWYYVFIPLIKCEELARNLTDGGEIFMCDRYDVREAEWRYYFGF